MIYIQPSAYLMAAALVLLLPPDWILSAFFAALFHEFGHLAAIYMAGVQVNSVAIGFFGAQIHTGPLEKRAEFLCSAAGPAASLMLLSLCRICPKIALCALVQGMFNLLPVYPMDGGRMLHCLLRRLFPRRADGIMRMVEYLILCGILVLALSWLICRKDGMLPALICAPVFSRLLAAKIPCKSS